MQQLPELGKCEGIISGRAGSPSMMLRRFLLLMVVFAAGAATATYFGAGHVGPANAPTAVKPAATIPPATAGASPAARTPRIRTRAAAAGSRDPDCASRKRNHRQAVGRARDQCTPAARSTGAAPLRSACLWPRVLVVRRGDLQLSAFSRRPPPTMREITAFRAWDCRSRKADDIGLKSRDAERDCRNESVACEFSKRFFR